MHYLRNLSGIILLVILAMLSACGGGGDGDSGEEVNLLGMWNYDITTTDACSGIVAKGIFDFQSLNGDITKLGDLLLQGEGFSVHSGVCNLVARNIVITEWRGRPAVQTVSEYRAFKQLDLVGTGQTVRYDTFTSNQIVEVTTVPGNVLTFALTR